MRKRRICHFAGVSVLGVLLTTAGCADVSKQPPQTKVESRAQESVPTLALRFTPGDSTTYKVTRENDKSVEWEGTAESKPKQFTGGHTGNKIEMTFTQDVQRVDDKGGAVVKITIKKLTYLATVKDQVVLDFDSSREKGASSPLGKLIGQSYTIGLTASGRVAKVIDAAEARAAIRGDSAADKTAANLLSDDTIKEMHTVSALPPADKDQARPGRKWSSVENFSFDLMGAKEYEKTYTLKDIEDKDNHRIATAVMKAVPSAQNAKELHKEQGSPFFANMFDSTETYTGELKLDLTDGKIDLWRERLDIGWMIVDPNAKPNEQPAALKMAATRLHSFERID
jgi:Family of unknown function (DUF6263)